MEGFHQVLSRVLPRDFPLKEHIISCNQVDIDCNISFLKSSLNNTTDWCQTVPMVYGNIFEKFILGVCDVQNQNLLKHYCSAEIKDKNFKKKVNINQSPQLNATEYRIPRC